MPSSHTRLKVIDPVEAGLPDQLALHIDPEIGTIVVVLRQVLVELRLELRERAGHDRPRTPEDGDLEVRDELPQSREVLGRSTTRSPFSIAYHDLDPPMQAA
jgi:hypothetical protein